MIIVDDAFVEKWNNPVRIVNKIDNVDQQEKDGIAALKRKLGRMYGTSTNSSVN